MRYVSKASVEAIQNLGFKNEKELFDFFNKTEINFQIVGPFEFLITSKLGTVLCTEYDWIVVWDKDMVKVMDAYSFWRKFKEAE